MNAQSTSACGCCEGLDILTPLSTANRPGLDRLHYRIGTHASFLESMQARLSSLCLGLPAECRRNQGLFPLSNLTTRAASDPALAFLDAWATVADVLTFYQERIANEGYLGTATEHRSILELGRLVGYRLRPGVAASVHLAFGLEKDFDGTVPRATRAQTVPAAGEQPQPFETSEPLEARYEWNELRPRLTQTSLISDPSDALYIKGISTNLAPNSVLAVEYQSLAEPVAYRVTSVEAQPAYDRTLVSIERWDPLPEAAAAAAPGPLAEILPAVAATPLPENLRAPALRALVESLSSPAGLTPAEAGELIRRLAAALLETFRALAETLSALPDPSQQAAAARETAGALRDVQAALRGLIASAAESSLIARAARDLDAWISQSLAILGPTPPAGRGAGSTSLAAAVKGRTVGLGSLAEQLLEEVPLEAIPPRTPFHLLPNYQTLLSGNSDLLPQLIVGFSPNLRTSLYTAYNNARVTEEQPVNVYALRTAAAVFGHNALRIPTYETSGAVKPQNEWTEWPPDEKDKEGTILYLDRDYAGVQKGGLVAVQVQQELMCVFRIDRVDFHSRNAYGISGKTTAIDLEGAQRWSAFTSDEPDDEEPPVADPGAAVAPAVDPIGDATPPSDPTEQFTYFIRGTAVYAESEKLVLAEEPVPGDLGGFTIELDHVYNGLQPGRWIIVSGEVTDLEGTSGVHESELVMLSAVEQVYDAQRFDETPHTRLTLANRLVHTYRPDSVTIYGNVINATHGETRREVIGSGDGSQPFQKFTLKQSPLTYVAAPTPSGVASSLEVRVNDVRWYETENLFQLQGGQRGYITRTDDEQKTTVIFGNGRYGARLPTGNENIRAQYRSGIGKAGNAAAEQISQLATRPLGVKTVINPLRASGGADPENRDSARRNVPLALLALDRLVSVQDYADFARTFAGIGKASAAWVSNGETQLVYLTIAGVEDIPIDKTSDLYRNLVEAIGRFGDPYQPFTVETRRAIILLLSAGVHLNPEYEWDVVSPKIRAVLLEQIGFERRELGQDVLLSEVVSVIQGVEGVDYVDVNILAGIPEELARDPDRLADRLEELAAAVSAPPGMANNPQPQTRVPVRLLPDESTPNQPAEIAYFSPDIPAALLLEEIP